MARIGEVWMNSDKRVYKFFKTKNWNSLDTNTKKTVLQQIENQQALKQNRQPIPIVFEQLEMNQLGAYSPTNQKIVLNENQLRNNYQCLETVIHEGYHREQHLFEKGDPSVLNWINNPELENEIKRLWQENMNNYSHLRSYEEYFFQPIELDVVERTYQEMVWNNELYSEPDYINYLSQKSDYIKDIRTEATKVYGVDYMERLTGLREIGQNNPHQAEIREKQYRKEQERYERS